MALISTSILVARADVGPVLQICGSRHHFPAPLCTDSAMFGRRRVMHPNEDHTESDSKRRRVLPHEDDDEGFLVHFRPQPLEYNKSIFSTPIALEIAKYLKPHDVFNLMTAFGRHISCIQPRTIPFSMMRTAITAKLVGDDFVVLEKAYEKALEYLVQWCIQINCVGMDMDAAIKDTGVWFSRIASMLRCSYNDSLFLACSPQPRSDEISSPWPLCMAYTSTYGLDKLYGGFFVMPFCSHAQAMHLIDCVVKMWRAASSIFPTIGEEGSFAGYRPSEKVVDPDILGAFMSSLHNVFRYVEITIDLQAVRAWLLDTVDEFVTDNECSLPIGSMLNLMYNMLVRMRPTFAQFNSVVMDYIRAEKSMLQILEKLGSSVVCGDAQLVSSIKIHGFCTVSPFYLKSIRTMLCEEEPASLAFNHRLSSLYYTVITLKHGLAASCSSAQWVRTNDIDDEMLIGRNSERHYILDYLARVDERGKLSYFHLLTMMVDPYAMGLSDFERTQEARAAYSMRVKIEGVDIHKKFPFMLYALHRNVDPFLLFLVGGARVYRKVHFWMSYIKIDPLLKGVTGSIGWMSLFLYVLMAFPIDLTSTSAYNNVISGTKMCNDLFALWSDRTASSSQLEKHKRLLQKINMTIFSLKVMQVTVLNIFNMACSEVHAYVTRCKSMTEPVCFVHPLSLVNRNALFLFIFSRALRILENPWPQSPLTYKYVFELRQWILSDPTEDYGYVSKEVVDGAVICSKTGRVGVYPGTERSTRSLVHAASKILCFLFDGFPDNNKATPVANVALCGGRMELCIARPWLTLKTLGYGEVKTTLWWMAHDLIAPVFLLSPDLETIKGRIESLYVDEGTRLVDLLNDYRGDATEQVNAIYSKLELTVKLAITVYVSHYGNKDAMSLVINDIDKVAAHASKFVRGSIPINYERLFRPVAHALTHQKMATELIDSVVHRGVDIVPLDFIVDYQYTWIMEAPTSDTYFSVLKLCKSCLKYIDSIISYTREDYQESVIRTCALLQRMMDENNKVMDYVAVEESMCETLKLTALKLFYNKPLSSNEFISMILTNDSFRIVFKAGTSRDLLLLKDIVEQDMSCDDNVVRAFFAVMMFDCIGMSGKIDMKTKMRILHCVVRFMQLVGKRVFPLHERSIHTCYYKAVFIWAYVFAQNVGIGPSKEDRPFTADQEKLLLDRMERFSRFGPKSTRVLYMEMKEIVDNFSQYIEEVKQMQ